MLHAVYFSSHFFLGDEMQFDWSICFLNALVQPPNCLNYPPTTRIEGWNKGTVP